MARRRGEALAMDAESAWSSLGIRRGFARAVHVRTRHIDAVFEESLASGANQVVILGALDRRHGHRRPKMLW